jgi:hypothetical protein
MAALTTDHNTPRRLAERYSDPVGPGQIIYAGAIVVLNGGDAEPGSTALALIARGVSAARADNTGGAAGAIRVTSLGGPQAYRLDNDGSIARANIGANCYIVDDHTVALTDGTGTRSVCGLIVDVDADGVWVQF